MYIVWCLVKSCKLHPALIKCSISELRLFGCRIFDIRRRAADRMSNIWHSTDGRSKRKNPTSEEGCFGFRIFDIRLHGRSNRKNPIRRRVLRMSNIRHSTSGWLNFEYSTFDRRPIESKKSDQTNKANRIEFATFDPTKCTRLLYTQVLLLNND